MNNERRSWMGRMIAGVTLLFTRCTPAPAHEPPRSSDLRTDWAKLADHVRDYATRKKGLSKDEAVYLQDLVWLHTPIVQCREDRVREFVNNFRGLTMTVEEVDHAQAVIDECAIPHITTRQLQLERGRKLESLKLFDELGRPICSRCLTVFVFDQEEPFANCACGTTAEWGHSGDKYRQIQWAEGLRRRLREKSPLFGPDRMPDSALQETIDYVEQSCPPDMLPDWYDKLVDERNRRGALRTAAPDHPRAGSGGD